MIRQAKREFERSIANNSKSNPKVYWAYIRKKLKTKIGVAPLLDNEDGEISMKFKDEEKQIYYKSSSQAYLQWSRRLQYLHWRKEQMTAFTIYMPQKKWYEQKFSK